MRNLVVTIFALFCLASVHSQDLTGTWNIDWQNNPYNDVCVPTAIQLAQDATTNNWDVNYTYTAHALDNICSSSTQNQLNSTFTNNSGLLTDTYGRSITFNDTFIVFTSNETSVNGANFLYELTAQIPQTLTLGTLGSSWENPFELSQDTSCCVPDALFFLPSAQGSGSDLIFSSYYYPGNTCQGQNLSNITLSPLGSNTTTVNWNGTADGAVGVQYTPSVAPVNITVTLYPGNDTCVYTYQYIAPAGPMLSNTWNQDWQTAPNAAFPTQYNVTSATNGTVTYMTSAYSLSTNDVSSFVVQTGSNLYTDTTLQQTFIYDSNTQALLSGNFLYSLNGSLLSSAPFVNFWGTPQSTNGTDCCIPTYINISANPANTSTLNVAYTLPEGYATITGCSGIAGQVQNGVINSTLSISQPSYTQLNWIDTLGTTITGNASGISAAFPQQCTFTMVVTSPPPPPITTGTYNIDWQNDNFQGVCVPQSFTLAQDSNTNAVNVTYTYSSQTQTETCPQVQNQLTANFTYNDGAWTDSYSRLITFNGSAIYFTPADLHQSFFFEINQTISAQDTLGTLGASWNNPSPVSGSGCCVPDVITLIPATSNANAVSYGLAYSPSNTCGSNSTTNTVTVLNGSTPAIVSYVDSITNPTFGIQYTPSTAPTNITAIISPGASSCTYTYQIIAPAGPALSNTWIQDWQTAANSSFPTQYEVSSVTPAITNLTYMTSVYSINAIVNSYVIQTDVTTYSDVYLGQSFTYDSNTQSLLSGAFLYSLNGSVLSPDPFVAFWGQPQTEGDTSTCCVPTYLNITQNPNDNNTLLAYYTLAEGYDQNSGCQQFSTDINNGVIESTLAIVQPSFTQLTWVDGLGATVTGNSSTITANFPQQCQFTMVVTSPPTPPGPLAGNWISTKVMGLVMGLFVFLAMF